MPYLIVTPPSADLITLAEGKNQLNVDFADDDLSITNKITAAVQAIENETDMFLPEQTIEVYYSYCNPVFFDEGPIISITSAHYEDVNSQWIEIADYTDYLLGLMPSLRIHETVSEINKSNPFPLKITMQVGYSDMATVPEPIKEAALLKLSELYEDDVDYSTTIERLVWPYRRSGAL